MVPYPNSSSTPRDPTVAAGSWQPLSSGRIPNLDGLRAISIAMVVGVHAIDAATRRRTHHDYRGPWNLLLNGNLGVSIFFVISGFLITHLLMRERDQTATVNLKAFYLRRSFRIWPAFFAYLAVVAVLDKTRVISFAPRDWLAAATFTFNYVPRAGNAWVAHSWSLSVEEQFYLAWPLAMLLLSRRTAGRLAVGLIVLVPLVRAAEVTLLPGDGYWVTRLWQMGHTRADTLMFGCAAALFYDRRPFQRFVEWCERWGFTLLAAIYLLASGEVERDVPWQLQQSVGYSLSGACIALVLVWAVRHAATPAGRVLNAGPVVHLGHISFSLYLWQQMFLISLNPTWTGRFPFNLILALGMAELSFRFVERPFLALRQRMMRPHAAPAEPAAIAA